MIVPSGSNMLYISLKRMSVCDTGVSESECWMFYTIPAARVIFTAKTSLDVFCLRQQEVWTFSLLSDRIYEMRCLFVALGLNARFIVLHHWDSMS